MSWAGAGRRSTRAHLRREPGARQLRELRVSWGGEQFEGPAAAAICAEVTAGHRESDDGGALRTTARLARNASAVIRCLSRVAGRRRGVAAGEREP